MEAFVSKYILFVLHISIIFREMESQENLATIAISGTTVQMKCPLSANLAPFNWGGPPSESTYYDISGLFNPNLPQEKLDRLSISSDTTTMSLSNVGRIDEGTYICKTGTSNGYITVHVRIVPDPPEIMTSATTDSHGIRATEGQELTVTCTSRGGYPASTVVLYKGSIHGQVLKQTNTQDGDSVRLEHKFSPTREYDRQNLVCRSYWPTPVESQYSRTSSVYLYMYLKPSRMTLAPSTSIITGTSVILKCTTTGSRPATIITWSYMDQTFTPDSTVEENMQTKTFTVESVFQRTVTAADNGKKLKCNVTQRTLFPDTTKEMVLDVQFPATSFTTNITGNQMVVADGNNELRLTCTTGSSNPASNITWKRGNIVINNDKQHADTIGVNNGIVRSQVLILRPTRTENGDKMTCSVSNGILQATDSATVKLNLHYHPVVTTDTETKHTIIEQQIVISRTLACTVDSSPPSNVTWRHNGLLVKQGNTNSSLPYTITNANRTSYGYYSCSADNGVPPSDSKTYTVAVLFRPLSVTLMKTPDSVIANGQHNMSLICVTGSSNPVADIMWRTDAILTSILSTMHNPGNYGGTVRTSTVTFNPTREHDGLPVSCMASNNVTGSQTLSGSTHIDNILYSPHLTIVADKTATEGSSSKLKCTASSKPIARFKWQKGGIIVDSGVGTASYNGLDYTINPVNRNHAGIYTCTADNQIPPNDSKQHILTVLYPPDIVVTATNTSVQDSSAIKITCEASGIPDQYTYTRWLHRWNNKEILHSLPLPKTKVLTLNDISYANTGDYICGASNGVNEVVSYGSINLLVKSSPVIIGAMKEMKIRGQLLKPVNVTFQYYSNAGTGLLHVYRINNTKEEAKNIFLRDINISLPVFQSEIITQGKEATITINITEGSQFGAYRIMVVNDIGAANVSVVIQPLGPPDPPFDVNITVLDHTSVDVTWISGFPNGLEQTFIIQLSQDNSTWKNVFEEYGGLSFQQMHIIKLDNLVGNQMYYIRIVSVNHKGKSEPTSVVNFKTKTPLESGHSSSISLIAGSAAGGTVAALAVVAMVVVVVWRRNGWPLPGKRIGTNIGVRRDKSAEKHEAEGSEHAGSATGVPTSSSSQDNQQYELLKSTQDKRVYEQLQTVTSSNQPHTYENYGHSSYESLQMAANSDEQTYDQLQHQAAQPVVYENLKLTSQV